MYQNKRVINCWCIIKNGVFNISFYSQDVNIQDLKSSESKHKYKCCGVLRA